MTNVSGLDGSVMSCNVEVKSQKTNYKNCEWGRNSFTDPDPGPGPDPGPDPDPDPGPGPDPDTSVKKKLISNVGLKWICL